MLACSLCLPGSAVQAPAFRALLFLVPPSPDRRQPRAPNGCYLPMVFHHCLPPRPPPCCLPPSLTQRSLHRLSRSQRDAVRRRWEGERPLALRAVRHVCYAARSLRSYTQPTCVHRPAKIAAAATFRVHRAPALHLHATVPPSLSTHPTTPTPRAQTAVPHPPTTHPDPRHPHPPTH